MHVLNAKGRNSGLELTLCTDGKWRPAGCAESPKTFGTEELAADHGQQIHAAGKLTHWQLTPAKEGS